MFSCSVITINKCKTFLDLRVCHSFAMAKAIRKLYTDVHRHVKSAAKSKTLVPCNGLDSFPHC